MEHPIWLRNLNKNKYPKLDRNIIVDVCVIGGGIAGITTAYRLLEKNYRVALIEAEELFSSTTARTTAKISAQHNAIYHKLIKAHGIVNAKKYADSNLLALDFIEKTINKHNIHCQFHKLSAYVYTNDESCIETIEQEYNACQELGLSVELHESTSLPFPVLKAIEFKNQAEFHPLLYLNELTKVMDDKNIEIFEHTRAININDHKGYLVETENGFNIEASHVVITTHYPFETGLSPYFTKLIPKRSYIVAAKTTKPLPFGMYINIEEPTHSMRNATVNGQKMILFGGETHKTGQTPDSIERIEQLKNFAKEHFDTSEILAEWSTQDYDTLDNVPYIGKMSSKNIYVATGFGKWGMTLGTLSGILITDLIDNQENEYASLYSPTRFNPKASIKNFVKEGMNVGKEFIKGKIVPGSPYFSIGPDEGQIINIDGKDYGAYCDTNGFLHVVRLTCTHLGCEVTWNNFEKTWDCPCHGSRFNYNGSVIDGPAQVPLDYEAVPIESTEDKDKK